MSDNIPFEIQAEIIKRVLHVKSLVRFRSVSKQWKSVIDSLEFITHHSLNQTQPHHLLVRYKVGSEFKYVSIAEDDSFPHHKFSPIVPPTVKQLRLVSMIDCSHGLVCLCGGSDGEKLIVLWNPSIRKSVAISIPHDQLYVVGVGVCPGTSDPKIFAVTHVKSLPGSAEVYTLSLGSWRSISMNLRRPLISVSFSCKSVDIDGVIHWISFDSFPCRIISFDLTSEEFSEVELPACLAHSQHLSIFNIKGSLAVLSYNVVDALVGDVWTMIRTGDPKSRFTKLFTVSFMQKYDRIIGFRKTGQMITERSTRSDNVRVTTLEVYDSYSEHNNHLLVSVYFDSYIQKTTYTESLLLLNHSDSAIL